MSRILLIAPTCDGSDIGEAWVAYQWAARLAPRHDVTLLTYHKRGRPPARTQLDGLRIVEWAEPPLLGRAERLNSLLKPGYAAFYVRARRWIKRALAAGEHFDVVHQPVPVAMRYPSPAAGLGVPVVVGPVGGGLSDPPGFSDDGDTSPWYTRLRALDQFRLRHDPLLRRTYTDARVVLGIAPYVGDLLEGIPLHELVVMSETALPELPPAHSRSTHPGALRLLFVGRLVRTKGARDLVRAMSLLADEDVVLDVVGDGPDRATCEALAVELEVADRVRFLGRLDRGEVDAFYRDADVFVFPSYREPGGNVALEAMGHGLPLIVCDRGGPGSAVDATCAIALPVSTPDALARDVAAAVRTLAHDPARRLAMGRSARERVTSMGLWDAKIRAVEAIYNRVGSGSAATPHG
ncbi:glycosyltransferase [Cellulomonas sp. Root930]|nr:glycosyltransferase [Cellulomonas sp. Root930]